MLYPSFRMGGESTDEHVRDDVECDILGVRMRDLTCLTLERGYNRKVPHHDPDRTKQRCCADMIW